MSVSARRSSIRCLLSVSLVTLAVLLAGCGLKGTGGVVTLPPLSFLYTPTGQSAIQIIPTPQLTTVDPVIKQTPTLTILGSAYDFTLDLRAAPVELPLVIQIPAIKVGAPILGVGLTEDNAMDAPKGPYGDPAWSSAFWYRGSAIPGDPGTATIAAHVNGLLGEPQPFANLKKLRPGDLIIIHVKNTTTDIHFTVDEIIKYSIQESSDPAVLARIYGIEPPKGTTPGVEPDGLSHLTLITCTGNYKDGEFDHHWVVYATRSD